MNFQLIKSMQCPSKVLSQSLVALLNTCKKSAVSTTVHEGLVSNVASEDFYLRFCDSHCNHRNIDE